MIAVFERTEREIPSLPLQKGQFMRYRLLGRTGLFVSEIALGTNTFGGEKARWQAYGALNRQEAADVLGAAVDRGINIIDTADSYGEGDAETRVGTALKDLKIPRSDVLIATKGYPPTGNGPNAVGLSRAHLLDAVEGSLRRLSTDYIDIYMFHSFDPHTPIEESLAAIDIMVRQGKIRYVGCSNFAGWQIAVAHASSQMKNLPRLEIVEAMYTLAARDVEREIIPAAKYFGMSVIVWGALGAGLLTGKYARDGSAPPGARLASGGSTIADRERALDAVDAMRPIAEAKGVSIAQLAIAWVLGQQSVASVVVGCKSIQQLEHNLGALNVDFSEAEAAALNAIAPLRSEYPQGMQALMNSRRRPR